MDRGGWIEVGGNKRLSHVKKSEPFYMCNYYIIITLVDVFTRIELEILILTVHFTIAHILFIIFYCYTQKARAYLRGGGVRGFNPPPDIFTFFEK